MVTGASSDAGRERERDVWVDPEQEPTCKSRLKTGGLETKHQSYQPVLYYRQTETHQDGASFSQRITKPRGQRDVWHMTIERDREELRYNFINTTLCPSGDKED